MKKIYLVLLLFAASSFSLTDIQIEDCSFDVMAELEAMDLELNTFETSNQISHIKAEQIYNLVVHKVKVSRDCDHLNEIFFEGWGLIENSINDTIYQKLK